MIKLKDLLSEEYHVSNKDYRMYCGNNHIVAMFEDNSRITFEVHFRDKRGEIDKDKWRRQAMSKWKSVASELHKDVQMDEGMNEIVKPWKTCFEEALKDERLKQFIRDNSHQKVFPQKVAPCIDPVNFSPR